MGIEKSLLATIRRRQLRSIEHAERKGGLEKLVLEWETNGRNKRGKQPLKYLKGQLIATE